MVAQLVKKLLQFKRLWFNYGIRKIHWRTERLPTPAFLGFPGGSGEESTCNVGDLDSVQQDPLEKGMATHSSIQTLQIPIFCLINNYS